MTHKVLIVDDDKDIAEAIQLILKLEEFDTQMVTDHEMIVSTAKKYLPDVILLDILLSGVDGREICRSFKKDRLFQRVPVIMMSAYPDANKSALEAGATEFLPKPFDAVLLVEKVQFCISQTTLPLEETNTVKTVTT